MILGPIPPPRNFAKIHARGGRGLQPEQPKDSIPPWGHSGTRRRGRRLCRSRAGAAKRRWCASAGWTRAGFCRDGGERALCRAARRALSAREAGAFLPGGGPPTGRGRGLAAWGPQRPRVGRDGAGQACWPGGGARAVYGGFPGRTRGRRGLGRRYTADGPGIAGGGGPIAGARRAAAQDGRKTL